MLKSILKDVWKLVVEEMEISDAFQVSAVWKQKGDTLFSHAMIHLLLQGALSFALPSGPQLVLVFVVTVAYLTLKELRQDLPQAGFASLPDSTMDTLGIAAGGILGLGLGAQELNLVIIATTTLLVGWLSYPVMEVLKRRKT